MWAECRDWHLKHGEQAVNWEAAFRMWIRKADEFARARWQKDRSEMPQEPGQRGERFVTIRKVIDDIDDEESGA
jgi:hypothetical protein